MYTKLYYCCFAIFWIFAATTTFAGVSQASPAIVGFDFEDPTGAFENAPEMIATGLSAMPWFDLQDSLTDFSGNPSTGRALAARAFVDGNSLSLILDVAPGFAANIDAYAFDHMASSTGPQNWEFRINDTAIAGGNVPPSFTTEGGPVMFAGLTGEIRLELFGIGATSTSGTYRFDNFMLSGDVTPVPLAPGIVLFGSALAFMPRLRKR